MHLMTSKNSFFCSWVTSGLSATRWTKGTGGDVGGLSGRPGRAGVLGNLAWGVVVLG